MLGAFREIKFCFHLQGEGAAPLPDLQAPSLWLLRVGRGRGARSSHEGWCDGTQRARALREVSEGRGLLSAPEKKPFQSPRKPWHEGIVLGKGKPGNRLVPRVSGAFTSGFVVLQETLLFQKLNNPTFRASFQCSRVPAVIPRGKGATWGLP